MMPLEKAFCSISEAMRSHHPLVHHITNYVTAGFCADAALAIGASPMMADEEGEMPAISQLSDALVLNLGTMNERTYGAMKKADRKSTRLNSSHSGESRMPSSA